jgi:hypothetical protein
MHCSLAKLSALEGEPHIQCRSNCGHSYSKLKSAGSGKKCQPPVIYTRSTLNDMLDEKIMGRNHYES